MAGSTDWPVVKLGDIAAEVTVGHVGPMASEYVSKGVPFLRSQNVQPFGLDLDDVVFVNEAFHDRLSKSALRPGDVVIVRTGTPGAAAMIPDSLPVSNCADLVIVRPGPKLDPRFLMYYINAAAYKHVYAHIVGAVQQHFNVGSAKSLELIIPEVEEQRAIARILGALDDKISLNGQMNRTLESTARSLFRSWFVDFDPVVTKGAGREPEGLSAEIADLFPASFSGPDALPTEWRLVPVYDVAHVVYGAPFSSQSFNTEGRGLPLLRIRDLEDQSPGVFTDENHPKGTRVNPGDVVVGMDGEFRAVVWQGRESWLNQRVCQFVPKGAAGTAFVYLSILEPLAEFERAKVGTTVTHLGKTDIDTFRVVHPGDHILARFAGVTQPLMDRIVANTAESRRLSELRDRLLPPLLSGEIRVGKAEQLVGQRV